VLKNKNSHFNIANLFTFGNITMGTIALLLILNEQYIWTCVFTWLGGFLDIFDGKMARKYNLSTEFGVQLDSYADLLTFVIVPILLVYNSILNVETNIFSYTIICIVLVYYVISGIRRLITFNLKANVGEVEKYFEGFPTPLGAICLFIIFVLNQFIEINIYIDLLLISIVAYMLNSKVKVKHP